MASIPVILLNGTTADANEVMADFNEIYSNIDQTNIGASAKTGTGRIVLDTAPTISGLTLSNPVISGSVTGTYTIAGSPTLSGTFAGTPTYSGLPTFNAGVTLPTTQHVNFNVGGTTYAYENTAGVLRFATASTDRLLINDTNSLVEITGSYSLAVQPTFRIYVDGGGNTFQDEVSSDNLRFTIGGNDALRMQRASATKVNFGFNGNGVNPETLFAGADAVIGNSTTSSSFLVIRTDVGGSSSIGFSVANNTSAASIVYNDTVNVLYINGPDVIFANSNTVGFSMASGSAEFIFSGELVLPDLASPANLLCASARTLAKAWANINGIGAGGSVSWSVNLDFNVASVTGNSTSFTITWDIPFSNSNYAVSITQGETNWGIVSDVQILNKTSSQIQISRFSGGAIAGTGLGNLVNYNVIVYGT